MALNVPALERSFDLVAPRADEFAARFYERLFEKYPSVKSLFVLSPMPEQQRKLIASLVMIVQNLRNPRQLADFLGKLGVRHLDYGTRLEHFDAIGENLLSVLGEFAGEGWTDEVAQAWADAYKLIAQVMIKAAWPLLELASA